MKRIFTFVICAVMLFNTAAAVTAKELRTAGTMLDFVEKIGIINTETDAAEDMVTREILAVYIARMLGIDETERSGERYFADLENNAFSQMAVNALAERGIIAVPQDRYFRPGEPVTYNEAVKMLVSAAGYDIYAAYRGGYPRGYLSIADSLKITCSVGERERLTVSETAELIYKTLVAPVCTIDVMNGNKNGFNAEDSVLAQQFGILWQEGTAAKIAGQSIKSEGALSMGRAEINSQVYDIDADCENADFLGSYVKYFYERSDNADRIVFISDEVKRTDDIVIDIDLLEDFAGDRISYYKDYTSSKTVAKKLVSPVVVYNGIYLGEDIRSTIQELNKGSITVKDSDNDGEYDLAVISDYRNFIVNAVDGGRNTLYNKLATEPREIDCDEIETVVIKDEMGNRLDIADIAKLSAASVMVSKDKSSYAEVIVSSTEFSGVISSIDYNDFYPFVIVNSEEYKVDKTYIDELKSSVRIGETYYFKTDISGRIAYVLTDSSKSSKPGYVRRLAYDYEEEKCFLHIIDAQGGFETVRLNSKVRIDGKSYKKPDDIKTALELALDAGENTVKNHIICYNLNDDGVVTEIDTLSMDGTHENESNSITAVYDRDNTEKVFSYGGVIGNTTRTFGRAALITPKTTVFFLPGGVENPAQDKCYVGGYSNLLKENIRYTGNAYKLSKLNAYADIVLAIYDAADLDGNTGGSKYAFMIDKITREYDENRSETVQCVQGYENGVYKKLEAAEGADLSGLKRGDVVRFEYDVQKKISENGVIEKLYDTETDYPAWKIDSATGCRLKESASYTQLFQASFGNVVKVTDSCVFWAADGYSNIVDSADVNSLSIVVYDSESNTVEPGSVNDIYDAESVGVKCSKIMYVTRDNVGRCIYIFN